MDPAGPDRAGRLSSLSSSCQIATALLGFLVKVVKVTGQTPAQLARRVAMRGALIEGGTNANRSG